MLSSKSWMCVLAVTGLLLGSWSSVHAQNQSSQYSNQNPNPVRLRTSNRTSQRRANPSQPTQRIAAQAPANHVARAYVPRHLQNQGIQTGVVQTGHQTPAGSGTRNVQPTPREMAPATNTRAVRPRQVISEAPIYGETVVGQSVMGGSTCLDCGSANHSYSSGCASCGGGGCSPGFGAPVHQVIGGGRFMDDGYVEDGCLGSCGLGGCDGRGGCPPSAMEECWLNGLAGIFSRGEYFIGGTGFRSEQFQVPGATGILDDASFGFYGGFNFGVPLCKLTCGVLSGQVGVRAVSSEFDGNSFFDDNRDQTFFTAGLYRRVDYGLQFGVVADILNEEWFTETETVQIRGDIAWVYPSGSAFGFRFANGVQDDVSNGQVNGVNFVGLTTDVIETYRFYYRHTTEWGGYSDLALGWSNSDHFVLALDFDQPISETWSMQSNLTYLAGEDLPPTAPFAGNGNEAWNLSIGFAWRPMGRAWYRSYDRPLFNVADNGSLILSRN